MGRLRFFLLLFLFLMFLQGFLSAHETGNTGGTVLKEENNPNLLFNPQLFLIMLDETSSGFPFSHDRTAALKFPEGYQIIGSRAFSRDMAGRISVLAFTPMRNVLSGKFNFQEGDMEDGIYSGFPFGFGIKIATFNRLEAAAGFNVNPLINNSAGWGLSGSIKYNIPNSGLPVDFAIGAFYTWTGKNGDDTLNPGKGIGVYIPLSLEKELFSFFLNPSIFLQGPDNIVPSVLLSAGFLYHLNSWFNTGLSLRTEFNLKDEINPKLHTGLEGRFYPPPSFLFFSLQAGVWTHNSLSGGYAGLGIGIVY